MKKQSFNKAASGAKRLLCALTAVILLCACQAESLPDSSGSSASAPPQSENSESLPGSSTASIPQSDSASSAANSANTLPPAPPVCDVPFTQTESFPMPFEGGLMRDEYMLVDETKSLILSVEQALYDYDTMWLLLEENFPHLNAIQTELGIDWRQVKENYRQEMGISRQCLLWRLSGTV